MDMAEDIRIDSHKLIYHPERVARWLRGELIYPIEIEIGISGACNHRCVFCAVDYMGYQPRMLDADVLMRNLEVLGKKGLKSVIYAGEGEPLLHPSAPDIFVRTKAAGIDVAASTNGVLFTRAKLEACLQSLTWVRYSIAGATDATYEKIHQCAPGDLQRALANMAEAVEVKCARGLGVTLGAQLLLLPENKDEVVTLAKTVRDIGFDYLTVKPFSQHPQSKAKLTVDYSESLEIQREVMTCETEGFKVYFRTQAIENLVHEKPYTRCHGLCFMSYMDSGGDMYPCCVLMGRPDFSYGNIYEDDIGKIWESTRAQEIRALFDGDRIRRECREACRLDEINKYLDALKRPGAHVNFI